MLSGVTLLCIAGYIAGVAYHGNVKQLGGDLVQDKGYLKWILAIVVILALAHNPKTSDIGDPLLSAIMLALLYNIVNTTGLAGSLKNAVNNL